VTILRRQVDRSLPAIALDADGPLVGVPEPLALALFRIAQEAIRNAIRHADARAVCVRLRHEGRSVALEVEDDGRGFAVPGRLSDLAQAGHFGLVGLAERVDQARGTLAIRSSIGVGTRIAVRLPLVGPIGADERADSFPDRRVEEGAGPGAGGSGSARAPLPEDIRAVYLGGAAADNGLPGRTPWP
jgi:signal transduction histidine kinase